MPEFLSIEYFGIDKCPKCGDYCNHWVKQDLDTGGFAAVCSGCHKYAWLTAEQRVQCHNFAAGIPSETVCTEIWNRLGRIDQGNPHLSAEETLKLLMQETTRLAEVHGRFPVEYIWHRFAEFISNRNAATTESTTATPMTPLSNGPWHVPDPISWLAIGATCLVIAYIFLMTFLQ